MKFTTLPLAALLCALASAQSNPIYIPFSPGAVKGALYKPNAKRSPHTGILIAHRTSNFLSHIGAIELSRRGFLVLAMNPRSDNNEAAVDWELNALDIRTGVEFLRRQRGIKKVILFAHSGGGPTMSFYQAVAENGTAYCRGANKLVQCLYYPKLADLPKADGIVFVDAHPGNSVNGLRSLNPAINDPTLNPFSRQNGFNPVGPSTYSPEFQKRYFKAQADRMNKLIAQADDHLIAAKQGFGPYPDDDVFVIPRGQGARLMEFDLTIHHATLQPRKLLRNDGTIVTQIVESVRTIPSLHPSNPAPVSQNASFHGGARLLTLTSFLSANAIRATDSMEGIDWCSSNNSVPCAVAKICVPVLFTAMGGHYFIRDNELHYEMSASKDKDFVVIEGATHGITPCTACEKTPGQYSNVTKNWANYVQKWINARF